MTETQRRLRAARAYAGLTLDELADRVGVGRMTLVRMERGERAPKRMELRELAEATGLPLEFFTVDFTEAMRGTDPRISEIEEIAHEVTEKIDQLLTLTRDVHERLPAAGLPEPPGELGRRLREYETNERDRREQDSGQGKGARRGTGG